MASLAASLSHAAIIGIDNRDGDTLANGQTSFLATSPRYSTFRSIISSPGNTIVPLSSFNASDLAELDAVFIKQPILTNQEFSSSEISALHNFVSSGHGLVVMGEGGLSTDTTVASLNTLVSPYGVSYASTAVQSNGYAIGGLLPSPLTTGVFSIGIDYERPFSSISSPATDLTLGSSQDDGLAYITAGPRVVLLSDTSLFADSGTGSDRDITFGNNAQLLANITAFITATPEPTALPLLASALLLFSTRRTPATR